MRFLRYVSLAAAALLTLPAFAQTWTPLDTLNFSGVADGSNFTPTAHTSPSTGQAWTDVAGGKYAVAGGQLVGTPGGTSYATNLFVSGAAGDQTAQREVVTLSSTTQVGEVFVFLRYNRSSPGTYYLFAFHTGGGFQVFSSVNGNLTALNANGSSNFTYTAGHTYSLDVSATGSSPTTLTAQVTDTTTNTVDTNATSTDSTSGLQGAGGYGLTVNGNGSVYMPSVTTYSQQTTPPVTATTNLVFLGDSLTAELTADNSGTVNAPGIATVLAGMGSTAQASNAGFAGHTVTQLMSDYTSSVDALWQPSMKNYLLIQGCHNDYANSATPAQCISRLTALIALAKASHPWHVLLSTEPPAALTQYPANFNTLRNTSNATMRNTWQAMGAEGLADFAADGLMGLDGAEQNGTFYYSDKTHMTNAGYTRWGWYWLGALQSRTGATRTSLSPASFNPGTVAGGGSTTTTPASTATFPSGLPVAPFGGASYPLNQSIASLPTDTRLLIATYGPNSSAAATDTIDQHVRTYSSSNHGVVIDPSMAITVVNSAQHPELMVNVAYSQDAYLDESDSVDPTYTGPNGEKRTRLMPVKGCTIEPGSSDAHCVVPDVATNRDYELYKVVRASDGSMTAQQVTVWNMATGTRISDNGCDQHPCTSASAGGLAIFPFTARYEEWQYALDHNLPDIGHAIRVTFNYSRANSNGGWFVYPATHAAGNLGTIGVVEGQRYRIPASVSAPSGLSAFDLITFNTLKKYGAVMDDNGADWLMTGDTDSRWNGGYNFSTISGIMANQLEVVNNGCWKDANGFTGPDGPSMPSSC